MDMEEISSNPHSKEDPKTRLTVDTPLIFKESPKNVDGPPWRRCRQCGHPFSKMIDICPKCGKNQKELKEKSLEEIRAEFPDIIDNFINRLNDVISNRNRKHRR